MPKVKKARSNGHANGHSNGENRIARHLRENGDADNSGVENLDKVRDILFGSQMRDADRRFGRIEEQVVKETAEVRDEVRKRTESLETFIRKEVQSLVERYKTEQSQRADAIREVTQDLKETVKSFQQRAGEIQEQAAEAQRELRQDILDQSKSLRDELQLARAENSAQIDRAAAELREEKVDKSALADLFTEMAVRLEKMIEIADQPPRTFASVR